MNAEILSQPRSTITDSVYACKRFYTFPYTTVKDRILAFYMGPYYAQYIAVTYTEKYDHIRRNTEQNGDRIRTPYKTTVGDRFFSPYIAVFLRKRHGDIRSIIRAHVFVVFLHIRPFTTVLVWPGKTNKEKNSNSNLSIMNLNPGNLWINVLK